MVELFYSKRGCELTVQNNWRSRRNEVRYFSNLLNDIGKEEYVVIKENK